MILNDIEVKGIDSAEAYYFLNPIYLTITSESKFITRVNLNFTNRSAIDNYGNDLKTAEFRLQSNPEGKVFIDISDYVKSIVIYPNGHRAKVKNDNLPYSLNDFQFTLDVYTREDVDTPTKFTFEKLFVNGYLNVQHTNVILNIDSINDMPDELGIEYSKPYYLNTSTDLSETLRFYEVDVANKVMTYRDLDKSMINATNLIYLTNNCNDVYFRFLNQYGYYSIIVFSNYTYSTSSQVDNTNRIRVQDFQNNKVINLNSNIKFDKEFTAVKEFNSRFKGFIEDFITSQYVQVWNKYDSYWLDVEMIANSMPESFDSSFEVSYKFKLINSINL